MMISISEFYSVRIIQIHLLHLVEIILLLRPLPRDDDAQVRQPVPGPRHGLLVLHQRGQQHPEVLVLGPGGGGHDDPRAGGHLAELRVGGGQPLEQLRPLLAADGAELVRRSVVERRGRHPAPVVRQVPLQVLLISIAAQAAGCAPHLHGARDAERGGRPAPEHPLQRARDGDQGVAGAEAQLGIQII